MTSVIKTASEDLGSKRKRDDLPDEDERHEPIAQKRRVQYVVNLDRRTGKLVELQPVRKIPLLFPLPRLDPLETQTSSEVTKKKRWRGPTLGPAIAKHKARKPLKPFKIENELQDLEPGEGPSISKPVLTLTSAAETFDKDVIGENKTGGKDQPKLDLAIQEKPSSKEKSDAPKSLEPLKSPGFTFSSTSSQNKDKTVGTIQPKPVSQDNSLQPNSENIQTPPSSTFSFSAPSSTPSLFNGTQKVSQTKAENQSSLPSFVFGSAPSQAQPKSTPEIRLSGNPASNPTTGASAGSQPQANPFNFGQPSSATESNVKKEEKISGDQKLGPFLQTEFTPSSSLTRSLSSKTLTNLAKDAETKDSGFNGTSGQFTFSSGSKNPFAPNSSSLANSQPSSTPPFQFGATTSSSGVQSASGNILNQNQAASSMKFGSPGLNSNVPPPSNPFTFGANTSSSSLNFGSGSKQNSQFGQSSPSLSFGQPNTNSSFAQSQPTNFGGNSAPFFGGSNQANFGQSTASPFNGTSVSNFGSGAQTSFGMTNGGISGSGNAFGSPSSASAFSGATLPAFGTPNNNASNSANPFGNSSGSNPFGGVNNSNFGASSTSFGTSNSATGFGMPQSAPSFGGANFGAKSAPSFGNSNNSPFGGTSSNTFGGPQSAANFGAPQNSSFAFGNSQPSFGSGPANPFGAPASTSFGQPSVSVGAGPQSIGATNTNSNSSAPTFGGGFGGMTMGTSSNQPARRKVNVRRK